MGSDVFVVVSPERQLAAGVIQAVEHLLVEQFITQAAVECSDEGILLELSQTRSISGRNALSRFARSDSKSGFAGLAR